MISTSGHLISKFPEVRFHRTRIFKYSKGYLDAMVNAQANIDGHFFLEDFLNPSLIAAMEKVYPITPPILMEQKHLHTFTLNIF